MKNDLRCDAYIFWEAATDFRRDQRNGVVEPLVVAAEMQAIHDLTGWPLLKASCADIALSIRFPRRSLA